MSERGSFPSYQPTPNNALPPHRSSELANLVTEARILQAQREANQAEIDRLTSANSAIHDRLARIDGEIRVSLWDGNPIR